MPYSKTIWGSVRGTAARLRNLETQYEKAIIDQIPVVRTANTELRAEVAASEPTGYTGRLYQNSTDGKLYFHNGNAMVSAMKG